MVSYYWGGLQESRRQSPKKEGSNDEDSELVTSHTC